MEERDGQKLQRRLKVLMSPGPEDASPNPYNALLLESVRNEMEVHTFSFSRALFGSWDILHVHWPEAVLFSANTIRRWCKSVLMILIIIGAKLRRRPIVWTVHNDQPHDDLGFIPAAAFRLWRRNSDLRIHLNRAELDRASGRQRGRDVFIPHGIYPGPMREPGQHNRLLFFGAIRRYKGVPLLLDAFQKSDAPYELRVVGQVTEDELEGQILAARDRDTRISVQLGRLSESELDAELLSSDGVVLPYTAMTNSGAALLALSRGVPVLAPSVPAILELRAEVGQEWIYTTDEEIAAQDITKFIAFLRSEPRDEPDLALRNWAVIGRQHINAYSSAWRLR